MRHPRRRRWAARMEPPWTIKSWWRHRHPWRGASRVRSAYAALQISPPQVRDTRSAA